MEKCVFIYNPISGKGTILKHKDYIYNSLKNKYEVLIEETKYPHYASEVIKSLNNDISLVISAGGDGTFNEVISGNLTREKMGEKKFVLSHIPSGTANDYRNTFYNTKDIKKILEDILNGEKIDLDIFSINEKYFYYVAALGAIASISFTTSTEIKKNLGYFAYSLEALKELSKPSLGFNLTYKTEETLVKDKFALIIASNSKSVGGMKLKMLNKTNFSDGMFEFNALRYENRFQMIRDMLRIIIGIEKLEKIKNLQKFKTSSVSISFDELPNINWSIDGERNENIEKEVTIKKEGVSRVLVPSYTYKGLSI